MSFLEPPEISKKIIPGVKLRNRKNGFILNLNDFINIDRTA
jgi:hypothetical protein